VKYRIATRKPIAKVQASAVAAGFAGALSEIIVWVLSVRGIDVPPGIQVALAGVLSVLVTLAAGYITPLRAGEVERAE
jgi:hypothetical protein